jgi:asparagine synthase (glutamine-hydrolysing)
MCGISIAINKQNKEIAKEVIEAMNNIIQHRGPDDEGFYFGTNFAFGHRRLSILDLSKAGHQPFQWKNLWITYNGEVYNYIELREELKNLGHVFHTSTDTEVILAAFEEWGTNSFLKFNGMWAFAIYDTIKNEIFICRDHFGIKPISFTQTENFFLAGSEIKQFTTSKEFKATINKDVAIAFLIDGMQNYSEETIFDKVFDLLPGHYLKYDLTTHTFLIQKWYDIELGYSGSEGNSLEESLKSFRELFSSSVRVRMRSDVAIGSCLSGGLDSSAIVTNLYTQKLANKEFATITSCFVNKKYDEQFYSDQVTDITKFRSIKVYPDLDKMFDDNILEKINYHQDQPVLGGSCFSEYNVFRAAKENGLIVMLDGQGSDEYLCGYPEFYMEHLKQQIKKFEFAKAFKWIRNKADHKKISSKQEIGNLFRSLAVIPFAVFIKKILGKENDILTKAWQTVAKKNRIQFKSKGLKQLSLNEIKYTSLPWQLHSEDRNSMMFSIESRLPFLCPRLVEFSIGLSDDVKLRDGYSKFILRNAISEMPEEVRYRKDKMGFVSPDEVWIKNNAQKVRAELEHAVVSHKIFSSVILDKFDAYIRGEKRYDPIYFRIFSFNKFCRVYNISIS